MKSLKSNLPGLTLTLVMFGVGAFFYSSLPEQMATKFDFNGQPTQYSSRNFVVAFLPTMFLLLMGIVNSLVKSSPQTFSMPNSKKALDITIFGAGLLFLGMHIGMILDKGNGQIFAQYFSFGMALFLIVVGNVFGKTERNFFVGIRVPWTIASESNWKATHRFAGKLMVGFGIALFFLSFFYSNVFLAAGFVLISTLAPAYYSFRFFRQRERAKEKLELS